MRERLRHVRPVAEDIVDEAQVTTRVDLVQKDPELTELKRQQKSNIK